MECQKHMGELMRCRNIISGIAIFFAFIQVAACANLNSINRTSFARGNGQVHFTDAKQRAILTQRIAQYPFGDERSRYYLYRFCSEPPPDAFSVLSTAFSGEFAGSFLPDVESREKKELKAAIANSISESGSTIERTQTINLLRESMFRTCERFLNGALDKDEFAVQAARDQRAMIAILAIEQLTGVVRPQPTVLVSDGSAFSASKPEEVIKALDEAKKAMDSAETAHKAAVAERATKKQALETCKKPAQSEPLEGGDAPKDPAPSSPEGEEAAAESEEQAENNPEADAATQPAEPNCDAQNEAAKVAETSENEAKAKFDGAKSHYEALVTVAKTGGAGQGARTNSGGIAGSAVNTSNASTISVVAPIVDSIVERAFENDSELTFICVRALKDPKYPTELRKACIDLYEKQVEGEIEKIRLETAAQLEQAILSEFERFAQRLLINGKVDTNRLSSLVSKTNRQCGSCIVPARYTALLQSTTVDQLRTAFKRLPSKARRALLDELNKEL